MITAKDVLAKTAGIMMAGLYTFMASYMGLNSIFTIIIDGILAGLILLAALIIPLWFIPFVGPPLAIADTAIFVVILALFIIFKTFLSEVMGIASGNAPPVPACFAKSTPILLKDGNTKAIEIIKIGDVLVDDAVVTGVMKMSSTNQDIYKLNNILVTGRHRVFHPEMGLIQSRAHPSAVKINDFREEYVYCINTSSKRIVIEGEVFVDWDDLDPMDMYELDRRCNYLGLLTSELTYKDVHSYLESGIVPGSTIELDDGRSLPIEDIDVNDVLRFGETVIGIVKVDGKDINKIKEYSIDSNRILRSTQNIRISDPDLGSIISYKMDGTDIDDKSEYLYHLVTNTGGFTVNGIHIGDYNSGLEQHLKPSVFLSR